MMLKSDLGHWTSFLKGNEILTFNFRLLDVDLKKISYLEWQFEDWISSEPNEGLASIGFVSGSYIVN
jgi:hypothetical protein